MIQWSDHNTYKIALQGILDLYEQEKARNKDLEEIEKEHKEENGRLREEIDKKDKIINDMANLIEKDDIAIEEFICPYCKYQLNKECTEKECIEQIINYFTNKAEEDK